MDGVNFISVETAEEMFKESLNNLPTDVAIFSAAVSDFKVKNYKSTKIKKNEEFNLELEKNIDILNHISCLLYTSPSPRDLSTSRMPSSA